MNIENSQFPGEILEIEMNITLIYDGLLTVNLYVVSIENFTTKNFFYAI